MTHVGHRHFFSTGNELTSWRRLREISALKNGPRLWSDALHGVPLQMPWKLEYLKIGLEYLKSIIIELIANIKVLQLNL